MRFLNAEEFERCARLRRQLDSIDNAKPSDVTIGYMVGNTRIQATLPDSTAARAMSELRDTIAAELRRIIES